MPVAKTTTQVKKTATTAAKPASTPASTRSTAIASGTTNATVSTAAASEKQTAAAGQAAVAQGTGIFNWQLPNIMPSLDQFLGLPTVIDWKDIGIRVSMVITGVILAILVAWAFVRGKQTQQVTVNPTISKEAVEAAEVA